MPIPTTFDNVEWRYCLSTTFQPPLLFELNYNCSLFCSLEKLEHIRQGAILCTGTAGKQRSVPCNTTQDCILQQPNSTCEKTFCHCDTSSWLFSPSKLENQEQARIVNACKVNISFKDVFKDPTSWKDINASTTFAHETHSIRRSISHRAHGAHLPNAWELILFMLAATTFLICITLCSMNLLKALRRFREAQAPNNANAQLNRLWPPPGQPPPNDHPPPYELAIQAGVYQKPVYNYPQNLSSF